MGLFAKLKNDGLEEAEDRLGGTGGRTVESNIYLLTIDAMYGGQAKSGALNVTISGKLDDGSDYRETVYVTNKDGDNFFLNKNDAKKKSPLPGFTLVSDICQIICGKELCEMEDEEKVIKLYDYDLKKEVPTTVPMLVEALGKTVSVAIQKRRVNKQVKNAAGAYVDTNEAREENVIEKAFDTDTKLTVYEAKNGKEAGEFWDLWLDKNKGQTYDRYKPVNGVQAGAPAAGSGAGTAAAAAATAGKSLFGKKA